MSVVFLKAASVDDSQEDREHLLKLLSSYKDEGINISTEVFNSANTFLDKAKQGFDFVFLDIDMPEMNGISLANEIRKRDKDILIIFVTNLGSYALQGYAVNAFDFLVKPIKKEDLKRTITKAIERKKAKDQKKIIIKIPAGFQALLVSSIIYVEIRGHDLTFHTADGNYDTRGGLKTLEEDLGDKKFARCNNCFLVNLDYVQSVEKDEVLLPNDIRLPISRNKKKEFVKRFLESME